MRLIITGSGRCRTGFVALSLRAAGLFCGHETVFTPEAVLGLEPLVWPEELRATCGWLVAPLLPVDDSEVVQLVRHPLEVVHSQLAVGLFDPTAEQTVYTDVARLGAPEIDDYRDEHDRALAHWCRWNELIEPHARLIVPVDDLNATVLRGMARLIDATLTHPGAAMRSISDRYNSKEGMRPTVMRLRGRDFDPALAERAAALWARYADDWSAW